jgi:hypothetical protein
LIALALEGGAGGQDLFGKIHRGVAERELGVCGWRHGCQPGERRTAPTIELGPWERVRPTLGAAGPQPGATLSAEFHPPGIVSPAARAVHACALRHGRASGWGMDEPEPRCTPLIDM